MLPPLSVYGYNISIKAITVDKLNRIVVTGFVRQYSSNSKNKLYIARLLADGNLDGSFNSGGGGNLIVVENSDYDYTGSLIATDGNNNILVAIERGYYGIQQNGFASYISKYLENGTKESTFGNVNTIYPVLSLVTDNNSKVIFSVAGKINRLNSNGSLDKIIFQSPSGSSISINKLVIQPGNKIVGTGVVRSGDGNRWVFYVSRFAADGTLDQTFGNNGSVTTDLNFTSSVEDAIYLNKRLYVSGNVAINNSGFGTIIAYDASNVLLQCVPNKNVSVGAGQCSATVTGINPVFTPPPIRDRNILIDPYASVQYRKEYNGNVQTGTGSLTGTQFNMGTSHITYTYTDVTTQTCSFDVTVYDGDPPVARCKNITIQLNESGTATISPAVLDNGSTDGCGIKSMFLSKTTFNCSNVGANNVTLTVVDNSNNQSS